MSNFLGHANGRNIVGQQHPTMLGVVGTCCVRLHGPFIYSTCARLLFDYKELGLNADHTDFCGNMQLIEEIINHKAQPHARELAPLNRILL